MDIILKPDSLSLTGSMNHFIISSTQEVTFVLKYADSNEIIVQHTYTPNKAKRIEIDLENIITPLLSFQLQESTTIYRQPNIAREFLVNLIEDKTAAQESWQFTVLRAGIDNFADTASSWLKRNFLTWQPTVKPVTYYTPEFLSYYAVEECVAKCRAYIEENGSYVQSDLVLGNLSHGKVWTMPMLYGVIAGKLGKMPSYYDVWIEDAAGTRLTYIQRYYASDIRSEEEQWVLFENSLGGIDTFRAYGDAENTAKHTHNVAEIENDSEEYRVDTVREYKKNTGFLSKEERKWLLDFFPSLGKFLYTGNYVRRIVVTESDVSWQTKDLPSSYTFTYKYADARPYLNITRSEDAAPAMLDIKIPDVGSFTIAPRLVELERLPLSSGALFPVQSPYSDKWNITTAEAILEWFSREVTAAYKGDGAFGHRHDNMSVLNALDRIGGYLTLDAQKILAGLADEAKSARTLDPKSVDWEKIVRTDQDSIVNSLTTFMKGIVFGKSVRGESGISIYQDEEGNWHLDAEYLHVHRKLTAEEVEIMKTSHIKGKIVNSAGSFVVSKIERIVGAWRCYFRQEDADGRRIYNSMQVNDLALCETFNLVDAGGQLSNHYWHRRVSAVGTDYVDIADNTNVDDYASGSDVPQVGDEVVQLGNLTVPERQSAIIQSAAGEGAPFFKIIKGINSFTLPDPIFLFDKQKFEIRVENPANRGKYIRLQDFLESMQGRISSVLQQSDRQITFYFGDAVPSLTNEPANEWTDDETKGMHEHDVYYNRSYVETGGGRSYSFEKNQDGSFAWKEITDADVLKSLEAAQRAQDTADGKRRVFVQAVPVPPYDAGDQWSNATFGDKYLNDLLVCIQPKKKGEEFSIEDWQSAQHYTTKQFEAEFNVGGKSISAFVKDLRTGLEAVGMHMDGENSSFTVNAKNFKVQTPEGKVAFVASDGTIDASRVRMRCEHGSIYFGEVDGYPNIILANELGQPQIMLNHRGIVNKYGVDMELINASRYFVSKRDGKAYLGVNIIVRITNRGFQQNTYGGGDIKLTATLDDKSHEYITLQLGQQYTDDNKAIIAATTPITLKIGESGEMIYGGLFEIGSTSGGAVVAQKMSYSVRSVYYDTVITKSYVSELGGKNFSSDSGGNLINPSNGDEPPAVIPAPNMDV
nr:MAG TPA: Putative tail protein [Caudoviricetes sp.]